MINAELKNAHKIDKLVARLGRSLTRKNAKPLIAGLLAATDNAVDIVAAKVPRGPTGNLRRSVRRTTYYSSAKGRMVALVGYRTNPPRAKGRKTRPRLLQAVASESGWRGHPSFTGKALQTTAEGAIFPKAAMRYSRGFMASYHKQLKRDVRGTGLKVTR